MKNCYLLGCVIFLLPGCTSLYMPWVAPYESFGKNLGEQDPVSVLPPYKSKEVWLGYEKRGDGTQENRVGAAEQCVFAFEVDTRTRRMTGWRLASKNDLQECMPSK